MMEILLDAKVLSYETVLACKLKVPWCIFFLRTWTEFGLDNVDTSQEMDFI